jgi:hypothetical protein
MYIPITTAALALLTVAMILLQTFWLRVPPRLRAFLVRASIAVIVLHAIFAVTKWSTTSDRLNVLINWLAIAGYELLILLFSRLSPRWLTIPSATVLLVPLFASTIVIPLTHLFYPGTIKTGSLGNHLFYNVDPWTLPWDRPEHSTSFSHFTKRYSNPVLSKRWYRQRDAFSSPPN